MDITAFFSFFFSIWIVTFLITLVYQTIIFLLARKIKRDDLVDVGWGFGFVVVGFVWLALVPAVSIGYALILLCVSIWGIRLSYHIGMRFFTKDEEDRRYVAMKEGWKRPVLRAYFQIFILQAFLLSIIVMPVAVHANITISAPLVLLVLGLLLWCLGFYYQVAGDNQLGAFIRAKKKGMMKEGVWAKTRHPNYFGEMTMWWGIFIMTLISLNPIFILLTVIGPVTITLLLRFVSGVPMLEKHWEEKYGKEFEEYKESTPMLIPHIRTLFK